MTKFLILEDDPISLQLWRFRIKQLVPDAEITMYSSVDQIQAPSDVGKNFDVIIADIFLSGDTTGIDLINQLPEEAQRRTIITSSVSAEKYRIFAEENRLKSHFLQKPLTQDGVFNLLCRILAPAADGAEPAGRVNELSGNVTELRVPYRPVFLVTGCSSGIGAALAERLVKDERFRVVLTARQKSLELLRAKYQENSRLMILPLDLTDVSQIRKTVLTISARWGRVDVLINNAGVCYRSVMEQMDLESEEAQMRTNYLGPMMLMRAVIPAMREFGRGKIINVSSVSGIMGMPTMGSYSASKHALEGASESLWYELRPFGINITVVRPGFIDNEGHSHVASPKKARIAEKLYGPYADFYGFMRPFVARLMKISPSNSDALADTIMKVVRTQNPPLWVNATPDAKMFSVLRKVLPNLYFHKVLNFFFSRAAGWGRQFSHAAPKRLSA